MTNSAALAAAIAVEDLPFSPPEEESCREMLGRSEANDWTGPGLFEPARPVPALNRGADGDSEYGESVELAVADEALRDIPGAIPVISSISRSRF